MLIILSNLVDKGTLNIRSGEDESALMLIGGSVAVDERLLVDCNDGGLADVVTPMV